MRHLFTCIISCITFVSFGQHSLREYYPNSIIKPDLSDSTKAEIDRQTYLLQQSSLGESDSMELYTLLGKYGEVVESIWQIDNSGCSWYCGGGNYNIKSSSFLLTKDSTHNASAANDLDYSTSWITAKSGTKESITYYFVNKSPRVTSIIISNGNFKNDSLWKSYNRIKSLKLTVNNTEFGILNLEDSKTDQVFKLGTFGNNKDGSDLILKFEITDIYKGKKHNNAALTEIYFDGIDVH